MAKPSAPSGFRDFLPDAYAKRQELIQRIREVYESFGFQGMETPVVENLAVFAGKAGENEKLMFKVLKRGAELGRALEKKDELADLGLRFDLTVPLARFYATHAAELPRPFKRYQIGPVWRAEKPQHGRFREFIQCDVDVLGSASMMVEAEVVTATAEALFKLGFTGLKVRINSRPLLQLLMKKCGVPEPQVDEAIGILDKLDKLTLPEVEAELLGKGIPHVTIAKLFEFSFAKNTVGDRLRQVGDCVGEEGKTHVAQIAEILSLLPALPSAQAVFDPFLARGLDYYTGPIFEIAAEGVPYSLAGGGRFDELIEKLGGPKVPACGFSIGFERILLLMEERGLFGGSRRAADVLVLVPAPEVAAAALRLGAELRAAGLRVDVFPGAAKPGQQYETAEKKGIPFTAASAADGATVALKAVGSRDSVSVPRAEAAAWLQARLPK